MRSLRIALAVCMASAALAAEAPNTLTSQEKKEGYILLFNGRDLSGWDGDARLWSVRDGNILGSTEKNSADHNTFLIYKDQFADFELKFDIKLRNHNSGVQFRSTRFADWVVKGYQIDASEAAEKSAWGNLYDEQGKGRGLMRTPDEGWLKGKTVYRVGDWNHFDVTAKGRQVSIRLNGLETLNLEVDKTEAGVIAIQVHRGPPMEVEVRNLKLKPLK